MPTPSRPLRKLACTLPLALLLTACGGGDDEPAPPPDPLAPYRTQALNWQPCDRTILGIDPDTNKELAKAWARAGDKLRCTTMRAPLDWANPARGDIRLSLLRIASADAAQRQGALLLNPGGPGIDGLSLAFDLYAPLSLSDPDTPLGQMQQQVLATYDLVSFSPRGTGNSTTLTCTTNELRRFVSLSPRTQRAENAASMSYNAQKSAEGCHKNPLTPYINTDATAHDMDLVRHLLGDDKLNYLGYSYGGWLGAWYASLFPERVGRMVLDSNWDFSGSHEAAHLLQPAARQRLLDELLIPYAVRHADYFNLGRTVDEVRAVLPALSLSVQHVLATPLANLTYARAQADEFLRQVNAGRGLDQVLRGLPENPARDDVKRALWATRFVPGNDEQDARVRAAALQLYEQLLVETTASAQSIFSEPDEATFKAVSCNDTPGITDPAQWFALHASYAERYPMFGPSMFSDLMTCVFWGAPSVTKPPLSAMQGLDVLMLQSQYDAATPTEGAAHMFEQLPAARGIYVPGDFQHSVYPYQDDCVDATVAGYLLGQSPAERLTTCTPHPLEQDQVKPRAEPEATPGAEPATEQPKQSRQAPASATYTDPEAAAELIKLFKRDLGRQPRTQP